MYSVALKDIMLLIYLAICSLPLILILFIDRKKIGKIGSFLESKTEQNKTIKLILIILLLVFTCFAYISKPVYYSIYASGVIGDNLCYTGMAAADKIYVSPKHMSHPLFVYPVIHFLMKTKNLTPQDYNFGEKIFIWGSIPMRIFAAFGLFLYLLIFRRQLKLSFLKSFLCAAFLGVSFVYWCWAIQPNALSFVLVFELIAIFFTFKAIRDNKAISFILSAAFTVLCFYVHIASGYFCLGAIIFMSLYFILQFFYYKDFKLDNFIFYYIVSSILILLFYPVALKAFESSGIELKFGDFHNFIAQLSDYTMFGQFKIPTLEKIVIMLKENFITGFVQVFGILLPINLLEKTLIFLILTCVVGLVIIFITQFKSCFLKHTKQLLYLVVLFLVILTGFIIRNGGTHYYTVALPVSLTLFCLVVFSNNRRESMSYFAVMLIVFLILILLIYNGFSSKSVYGGRNVRSNYIYSNYAVIDEISPTKTIYFLEPLDLNDRFCSEANFRPITDYYVNKFSNIKWVTDFKKESIYDFLKNKETDILVGKDTYKLLSDSKNLRFIFIKRSKFQDFYRVTLKTDKK